MNCEIKLMFENISILKTCRSHTSHINLEQSALMKIRYLVNSERRSQFLLNLAPP